MNIVQQIDILCARWRRIPTVLTHLHSNCGSLGYADSLNTDVLVEVEVEGTEGRVDDSRGELDMWFNEGKKMRD